MTEATSPGQSNYEAYWQDTKQMLRGHPWDTLPPTEQAHWEAAAQAVLALKEGEAHG
jgi:hypothetical protein